MINIILASDTDRFTSSVFQACQTHPMFRVIGVTNKVDRVWALCDSNTPDALLVATNDWSTGLYRQDYPVLLLSEEKFILRMANWLRYETGPTNWSVTQILEKLREMLDGRHPSNTDSFLNRRRRVAS